MQRFYKLQLKSKSSNILKQIIMYSRLILGSIATILFAKQFITINKLQFNYPYISQTKRLNDNNNEQNITFRKNSYILSFRKIHSITNHFPEPEANDLVLCQNADGQYVFKIVGATSKTYTSFESGMSHYVPNGFVFLIDPVKKQIGMESLATISSKNHFSLGKWSSEQNINQIDSEIENTIAREILERNNIREQIRQNIMNIETSNKNEE